MVNKEKRAVIAGLPSGVGICKAKNGAGTVSWRLRMGKRFTGGAVVTKHFDNLEAARKWFDGHTEQSVKTGEETYTLTAKQLSEAKDAYSRLKELNLDLSEAITIAIRHARPKAGALTFEGALEKFLAAPRKRVLARSTASAYSNSVNMLAEELPKKKVHEISKVNVEEFIGDDSWEAATKTHHLRNLKIFYNWAVREGHSGINPTAGIPEADNEKDVEILTVAQGKALLAAADDDMKPSIAIALFAGCRTSEIRRLDWAEIGKSEIEIKRTKTKTRQPRMVSISKNLAAWLAPYRRRTGPLAPEEWREKFEELTAAAGWRDKDGNSTWPRNAMRHSFGTYHYAVHRNETLTAAEMGNSPEMVHGHYRRNVKAADAKAYWQIKPTVKKAVIIPFKQVAA